MSPSAPPTSRPPKVVRTQVEPRLAERRRRVLEDLHRRRRNRWIAAGIVLGLLAAAVAVVLSPLLDVDRVVVEGTSTLSEAEVVEASGVARGDQLVTVDLRGARAALAGSPMVAAATVTREWPDTVRIVVVEERPLAAVRSADREVAVADTGRVLPDAVDRGALAVLEVASGVELRPGRDVPDEVRAALLVLERLPEAVRAQLDVARLSDAGELELVLDDGATVRFGLVEDVPAKLAATVGVLEQVVRECMDVVDVREPSRATVSRVEGCATPAPTLEDARSAAPDASDEGAGLDDSTEVGG
ncbi:MAG: cell division protein FtsQ/DivIB [Microthrixaceae bacterium]